MIRYVPYQYKTRQMCNKTILENCGTKIQEMCDKAVDTMLMH